MLLEGWGREEDLKEDSIEAGAKLTHGLDLCLDLQKVPGGRLAPVALPRRLLGDGLDRVIMPCLLFFRLEDRPEAPGSQNLLHIIAVVSKQPPPVASDGRLEQQSRAEKEVTASQ